MVMICIDEVTQQTKGFSTNSGRRLLNKQKASQQTTGKGLSTNSEKAIQQTRKIFNKEGKRLLNKQEKATQQTRG